MAKQQISIEQEDTSPVQEKISLENFISMNPKITGRYGMDKVVRGHAEVNRPDLISKRMIYSDWEIEVGELL